jgi:hypothetical protein
MKPLLTADRLRELLHYDPLTGLFTRLVRTCNTVNVGDVCGYFSKKDGHLRISLDHHQYLGQRLAFLYMTGEWPANEVDYWDTDPANNRWANLRDVTTKTNSENKRVARVDNKSSGLLGVTWNAEKEKWQAQIGLRNDDGSRRTKSLGRYDDKFVAHEVYLNAKRRLHAGCTI